MGCPCVLISDEIACEPSTWAKRAYDSVPEVRPAIGWAEVKAPSSPNQIASGHIKFFERHQMRVQQLAMVGRDALREQSQTMF